MSTAGYGSTHHIPQKGELSLKTVSAFLPKGFTSRLFTNKNLMETERKMLLFQLLCLSFMPLVERGTEVEIGWIEQRPHKTK